MPQGRRFLSVIVLLASCSLTAGLAPRCRSLRAQQAPAPVVAKTTNNMATGEFGQWDFGGTDLTFKEELKELWILDAFSPQGVPFINAFKIDNMAAAPVRRPITLPTGFESAPILGIAEFPHTDLKGNNLLLIDPTFGTNSAPQPMLGAFDNQGNPDPRVPFAPVSAIDPGARLSAIDIHPTDERIVAYDITTHSYFILDFSFVLVAGPVPLLGEASWFVGPWFLGTTARENLRGSGVGIAFNGPDHVLATSGFFNGFETHLTLEYDWRAGGLYSGRAVDLGAAGLAGVQPELLFLPIDTGKAGNEDVLFSLNLGDDSAYVFSFLLQAHAPPVELTCAVDPATGRYAVEWVLPQDTQVDAFHIFENSVEVATLPANASTYLSPLPLLGKAFVEVVGETAGNVSSIRSICQIENSQTPRLQDAAFDATQVTNMGLLSGTAVTKLPARAADFRAYLVGQDSNNIMVLDHTLEALEVIQPDPAVAVVGSNLPAIGVALLKVNGADHLAILDPDGPTNNNLLPSATIFGLEEPNRGQLVQLIDPIDLSQLNPPPFLFDWDATPENDLVAGGIIALAGGGTEYVVVKIDFNDIDTMAATAMITIPQRVLTPFIDRPVIGIGVSSLPSGNLLIAGADTFSRTYTEAVLTTGFTGDPNTSVKFVGYAQGLPVSNQFFSGLGPDIGPSNLFGLDTAYFAPEEGRDFDVGVTYLPTGNMILIRNRTLQARNALQSTGLLFIHAENSVSHPNLLAEQLLETTLDVPAGQVAATAPFGPTFAPRVPSMDYYAYVLNPSTADAARFSIEARFDGVVDPDSSFKLNIPAGRYFRALLAGKTQRLELRLRNDGPNAASAKVILGATGIGTGGEPVRFRRGDCDANGAVQITDAIFGLNWLFKGGEAASCVDACDSDDNGAANVSDMIAILNHLFRAGEAPAAPGPTTCGADPTTDDPATDCLYPQDVCL